MSKMCEHNFSLLDVEKIVSKSRFSNHFKRTTRFFCTKCTEQKEVNEEINAGLYEERPEWTYNI